MRPSYLALSSTHTMARHRTISLEFQQKIMDALLCGESNSGMAQQFNFAYPTAYLVWL